MSAPTAREFLERLSEDVTPGPWLTNWNELAKDIRAAVAIAARALDALESMRRYPSCQERASDALADIDAMAAGNGE